MPNPLLRASLLLTLLGLLAACGGSTPEEEADDPRVLSQALGLLQISGAQQFWVVPPETRLVLDEDGDERLQAIAAKIAKAVGRADYDARPVLDRLLKRNKRPRALMLASSTAAPYRVDDAGTFERYTASGNEGDWKRMYMDHPEVAGVAHVGFPAYDRDHGIALVYILALKLPGSGNGSIFVLDDNGVIVRELGRIPVWSP